MTAQRSPFQASFGIRAKLLLTSALLVLFASSCSSAGEPLDPEAARQFDIANNAIADLTPVDGAEDVPRDSLMQSVLRAQTAGTTLRIVVSAANGEFVSAKSVVDRYGGTAIAYQADRTGFEGASRDMDAEQLDRAVNAAKSEFAIGDSAAAFVNVIETEGIQERGRSWGRWMLFVLLVVAAIFMVSGALSYWQARKRRIKRQLSFEERKWILSDWAKQLGPEVESLRPLVAASPDDTAQQSWHQSQEFVAGISSTLEEATSVGDLDMAEMRIGRTAIKLRDLRQSLDQ